MSGDAEEVYRDLLLGDIIRTPAQGRYRWEKRLSHEEVLAVVEDITNHEKIPVRSKALWFKELSRKKAKDGRTNGWQQCHSKGVEEAWRGVSRSS